MYLKALMLQGFKSFPEKTVLTFDQSITAIVGPNGSGKSNLSDAVRWVMGEQSTRALRGGRMEDVIFGGTAKRRQTGYAQVSLVLDNSDHRLPREENEVMVTRRYYRSGESEYYINRDAVRLKDVSELFLDTGLGREGYAIIGQGRIDEILSQRSTDRREVFEEAAGISRFRHRKEEAQRKLERTDENLLRVNDKVDELELQLEPLRAQRDKAKKYLMLRDELRGLEIAVWLDSLEHIRAGVIQLETDLQSATVQRDGAKSAQEAAYADAEDCARQMQEHDVTADGLRRQEQQRQEQAGALESAVAVLNSSIAHNDESARRIRPCGTARPWLRRMPPRPGPCARRWPPPPRRCWTGTGPSAGSWPNWRSSPPPPRRSWPRRRRSRSRPSSLWTRGATPPRAMLCWRRSAGKGRRAAKSPT